MTTEDQTAELNPPGLADVEAVIATARAQFGKPYKIGTEGPLTFDCSGLMWYIFKENGLGDLIGGGRHRARWYARWFQDAGHFTPLVAEAKRGDLVVYGKSPTAITHIGIYLGPQKHRAISALINPFGVSRHRFNALSHPVAGFCQVQWEDGTL